MLVGRRMCMDAIALKLPFRSILEFPNNSLHCYYWVSLLLSFIPRHIQACFSEIGSIFCSITLKKYCHYTEAVPCRDFCFWRNIANTKQSRVLQSSAIALHCWEAIQRVLLSTKSMFLPWLNLTWKADKCINSNENWTYSLKKLRTVRMTNGKVWKFLRSCRKITFGYSEKLEKITLPSNIHKRKSWQSCREMIVASNIQRSWLCQMWNQTTFAPRISFEFKPFFHNHIAT